MKHAIAKKRWLTTAVAAVALMTVSAWAQATTTHYQADLGTLNNSGVTGTAYLTLNDDSLTVRITASGLQVGHAHAQHIHGTFDANGNPTNATSPTVANQDTNGDGYVELGEGQATYGPILVPLSLSPGSGTFPTPAADGSIDYTQTFDLTDSSTYMSSLARPGTTESDLFPLDFREIVLHGMNAPIAINNNALGLSFALGEYDPVFPVASGVIFQVQAVPEPADFGMMLGGLGLLLGLVWLRRKDSRELDRS